ASAPDPDGSRVDLGYFTFVPPQPVLTRPLRPEDGAFEFWLNAYTNRNYVVEFSDTLGTWSALRTVWATNASETIVDDGATSGSRFYRVRLAP
ncbi:MAG TPA: hypothetical protein VLD18_16700, partial [Verrucomicrobiae bacterium]|nr:hypothetical protein [Verrucomicrobiae bacterium]